MGVIVVEWLMKCRCVLSCVVGNRDVIVVEWLFVIEMMKIVLCFLL